MALRKLMPVVLALLFSWGCIMVPVPQHGRYPYRAPQPPKVGLVHVHVQKSAPAATYDTQAPVQKDDEDPEFDWCRPEPDSDSGSEAVPEPDWARDDGYSLEEPPAPRRQMKYDPVERHYPPPPGLAKGRRAPRRSGKLGLGFSFFTWASKLTGNLKFHRDAYDDYDRINLGESLGLEEGLWPGLTLSIRAGRTISLEGTLSCGFFRGSEGELRDPYVFEGTAFPAETEESSVNLLFGRILLDFATVRSRFIDLNLLVGLSYWRMDLETQFLSGEMGGLELTGGVRLAWKLHRRYVRLQTGLEIGLGPYAVHGDIHAALVFQPVRSVELKFGARAGALSLDNIDADTWQGHELNTSASGVFGEFALKLF
jgi:hypothetical protein